MVTRSSKSTLQPDKHNQLKSHKTKCVKRKLLKTPQHKRSLASVVVIAMLLGSACMIGTFTWIGIQLILHPDQVVWLNKFLPEWVLMPRTTTDSGQ